MLDDSTFTDHDVIQLNREITFVKINGTEDTILTKAYGIAVYPTVVLLNKNGEEIDRILGFEPPVEFLNTIELYRQGKETLRDYLARFEASPDSVELIFTIAEKYEGRSELEEARNYYLMLLEKDKANESGYADESLHSLSWLAYRDKDFQGAITWEEKLIEQFPSSEKVEDAHTYIPYYYSKWAAYEKDQGNARNASSLRKKAIELYNGFLEKYPESDEVEWVNEQIEKLKES
ncbi:MAG: hypothetical protein GF307_11000 [candidate division Zixibacteria bacterium]|nr:hypothetical protein [candidate division Zixibacteria bacterium]